MPDTPDQYRNVTTHPQPLASGRVLATGEAGAVSDDPHDQALIDDGALLPVDTGKPTRKKED